MSQQQMSHQAQQRLVEHMAQQQQQQQQQRHPMAASATPTVGTPGGGARHLSSEQLELKEAITTVVQYAQVGPLSLPRAVFSPTQTPLPSRSLSFIARLKTQSRLSFNTRRWGALPPPPFPFLLFAFYPSCSFIALKAAVTTVIQYALCGLPAPLPT
jgi:hypothetical protein